MDPTLLYYCLFTRSICHIYQYQPSYNAMTTPIKPGQLFKSLLHLDFSKEECIQQQNDKTHTIIIRKNQLKKEIQILIKNKMDYLHLIQKRNQLKQNLSELLNYRQSIDYDHKYKTLKFDHYQFPYRNNYVIKEQINNLRLQNTAKRRKINELQEQLKRKELIIHKNRAERQNFVISNIASIPTKKDIIEREDKFWLNKIDSMKSRYLNTSQEYKRAKIRHDYNLFVEKNGCLCVGMKVCPLCSDLNLETKRNTYTYQALLSPRYKRLYK